MGSINTSISHKNNIVQSNSKVGGEGLNNSNNQKDTTKVSEDKVKTIDLSLEKEKKKENEKENNKIIGVSKDKMENKDLNVNTVIEYKEKPKEKEKESNNFDNKQSKEFHNDAQNTKEKKELKTTQKNVEIKKKESEEIFEDNLDMINEEIVDDVIFCGNKTLNKDLGLKVTTIIEKEKDKNNKLNTSSNKQNELKKVSNNNISQEKELKKHGKDELYEELEFIEDAILGNENIINEEIIEDEFEPKKEVTKLKTTNQEEKKTKITPKINKDEKLEEIIQNEKLDQINENGKNVVKQYLMDSMKESEKAPIETIKEINKESGKIKETLNLKETLNNEVKDKKNQPNNKNKKTKDDFERLGEVPDYVSSSDKISKKKPKAMSLEPNKPEKEPEQHNNRYEIEDSDLNHIRINRSFEENEVRQNIDQFDIEYMCRCLGLALMKHIEASKEKFHILDVISTNEKFDFFNSVYNMNIEFFNTFYNLEAKMSNLEKIEAMEEEEKEKHFNKIYNQENEKCEIQFKKEKSDKKYSKDDITSGTFGHIKYDFNYNNPYAKSFTDNRAKDMVNNQTKPNVKDIKLNEPIEKTDKYELFDKQQQEELEREMKAINDYFKNGSDLKTNKYMKGDLSQIREEDSLDFCTKNGLLTNNPKIQAEKKNLDYINLMQSSMVRFLGAKDEEIEGDANPTQDKKDQNAKQVKILVN